jgi:hypothetical protein
MPKSPKNHAPRDRKAPVDLGVALATALLTNEQINQTLLDILDPTVWEGSPPCSKRRNIATSFAHIHDVRRMRRSAISHESHHRGQSCHWRANRAPRSDQHGSSSSGSGTSAGRTSPAGSRVPA